MKINSTTRGQSGPAKSHIRNRRRSVYCVALLTALAFWDSDLPGFLAADINLGQESVDNHWVNEIAILQTKKKTMKSRPSNHIWGLMKHFFI